jgi:hypothetical protein
MGIALITRRGGSGGGDLSLKFVEYVWEGNSSSVLDKNAVYIISAAGTYRDSVDDTWPTYGVFVLKSGVLTEVSSTDGIGSCVSYNASTGKIRLNYYEAGAILAICKVG